MLGARRGCEPGTPSGRPLRGCYTDMQLHTCASATEVSTSGFNSFLSIIKYKYRYKTKSLTIISGIQCFQRLCGLSSALLMGRELQDTPCMVRSFQKHLRAVQVTAWASETMKLGTILIGIFKQKLNVVGDEVFHPGHQIPPSST